MRLKYSLLLSISLHLLGIILLILHLPVREIPIEEEIISIELVTKKEENSVKKSINTIDHVDIENVERDLKASVNRPEKNSYISESYSVDLVLKDTALSEHDSYNTSQTDWESFEMNLLEFQPDEEIIDDEITEEPEIVWNGDSREVVFNSYIDFSSFPETSFTGVGATVSFSVNESGEVFNVIVVPPGSGSIDFDILIKQYVSRFRFNKRDKISSGELVVKYKK